MLCEIGYIKPALISDYVSDFMQLLSAKDNRLVWSGMIALATIADLKPAEIFEHLDEIKTAVEHGSVITIDNGIKVLAKVASTDDEYRRKILPYLMHHLRDCRPKDVPQHAESILCAVNTGSKEEFINILHERQDMLTAPQSARIKKLLKRL